MKCLLILLSVLAMRAWATTPDLEDPENTAGPETAADVVKCKTCHNNVDDNDPWVDPSQKAKAKEMAKEVQTFYGKDEANPAGSTTIHEGNGEQNP